MCGRVVPSAARASASSGKPASADAQFARNCLKAPRLLAASPLFAAARARPSTARLRLGVRVSARSNQATASFGAALGQQHLAVQLVGALDRIRSADRLRHAAPAPRRRDPSPRTPRSVCPSASDEQRAELVQHHRRLLAQRRIGARCDIFSNSPTAAVQPAAIAELVGAQAQREQLVDVVERALPFHLAPALALDDVARAHRAAIVAQRRRTTAASDLAVAVMMAADLSARADDLQRLARRGARPRRPW